MSKITTKEKRDVKTVQGKVLDDKKINVILLGASGSGKSTLINAFIDPELEKEAPTGVGSAVTEEIGVYGDLSGLPFRLIDTPGFEYSHKRQDQLKKEIKKWLRESVKNQDPMAIIHTIWFCVDGSGKRLPEEMVSYLQMVSDFWKDIPIIFVSTKTYSEEDAAENERMIQAVLDEYGRDKINVKAVVSVLAKKKGSSEPMGLDELKAITERVAPEAKKIFEKNWKDKIKLNKRLDANKVVISRSLAAMAADAAKRKGGVSAIISAIQFEMFEKVAAIYDVDDENNIKLIATQIMSTTAITAIGKRLAEKAIPLAKGKFKLAAKAATATVSGVVTLVVGQIAIIVFENIFMGDLDVLDTDWEKYIEKILKDKSFTEKLKKLKGAIKSKDGDSLIDTVVEVLGSNDAQKDPKKQKKKQ